MARHDTEDYLRSLEVFGMRPGLDRVEALLALFDHPERRFRCIHVVGTNGKSSTTRYCEAVLAAHGLRSGAYLSPHIAGFAERVMVAGEALAGDRFAEAVAAVRLATPLLAPALGPVTQFEVLTVAALLAFAREGVEAAAVEAGLGGRLDATNVLRAPVVVVTSIGLEHTEVLGDTREAIFAEKAAVITGGDAVFGPLDGLEGLALATCQRVGARAHLSGRDVLIEGAPDRFSVHCEGESLNELAIAGRAAYQVVNASLALTACRLLLGALDPVRVRGALAATMVPGRLQVVGRDPLLLVDGAHNPDGVRALVASLATLERPRPRVAVLAVLRDKAVAEMLARLAPLFDVVVCTRSSDPRSLSPDELAEFVRAAVDADVEIAVEQRAGGAVERARALAGAAGSIVVTGSLYLLADLARLVSGDAV